MVRNGELFTSWLVDFVEVIRDSTVGYPLRDASLAGDLKAWTSSLTKAVVLSCERMQWRAAGKAHKLELLPKAGQEYLSLDVMGFDPGSLCGRWPLPVAAFELENHPTDDRVAYSLWKVLCVKVDLRVVFAFRTDWDTSSRSVEAIADDVIGSLSLQQLHDLTGDTAMIFGNRGNAGNFPDGFFKSYLLDKEFKRFIKADRN